MQPLQIEIDQNYDWFQRNVASYLAAHKGQFAVLRHQSVHGFYAGPGEALRMALSLFPDGVFSIQEVDDTPVDLGCLSLAAD